MERKSGILCGKAFLLPIAVPLATTVLFLCSCSPELPFRGIIGTDVTPPGFQGIRAVTADKIELSFSESVSVMSLRFEPPVRVVSIDSIPSAGGPAVVSVSLATAVKAGERCVADLVVEDAEGNSLTVLAPFLGRNDRLPSLLINEVRTEYSKPKVEFVEIFVAGSGNLGVVGLYSASVGFSSPLFVFPSVEVVAGEYLLVHLRTVGGPMTDETGFPDESDGYESCATARDFWVPGSEKRVRKTDALMLSDQDGAVLDALLMSENADPAWKSEAMAEAARHLAEREAWKGSGPDGITPQDALASGGCTPTRSACRDETRNDGNGKSDWYLCATACATPGKPNRIERWEAASSRKPKK